MLVQGTYFTEPSPSSDFSFRSTSIKDQTSVVLGTVKQASALNSSQSRYQ